MSYQIYIVLFTLLALIILLYTEKARPSFLFIGTIIIFLLANILTPEEILSGLSNKQIIVIFLLIILSSGLRKVIGNHVFSKIFKDGISPKSFLLRMMATVSVSSAFLNNTPIVAFMIPYVKDWADKNNYSASKFLIPLSYITILGGMITVVGTSTNLILNGLIAQSNLKILVYTDFLFLGLIVTVLGLLYFYFIGYKILPEKNNKILEVQGNIKEFIVETKIKAGSNLIGKTVKNAGLRALKDIFLVEIVREGQYISPVSPQEILRENDVLFFTGKTSAIYQLISESNGLSLPDEEAIDKYKHFQFTEAIVPANSSLVGERVKDSDFRRRFNSSIVAVHRHGQKLNEKIGEVVFNSGDMLLLLSGEGTPNNFSELVILSKKEDSIMSSTKKPLFKLISTASFVTLILGIVDVLDLFTAVFSGIGMLVLIKVLNIKDIKNALDFDLLILLVSALAIGIALTKTGAADILASQILFLGNFLGIVSIISILFVSTLILTSLITNPAAVSIVFPIAASLASKLNIDTTPMFVTIAFAASGDFITPIGYQTNLMVMGPGGYTFKDYFKVGLPLTVLYTIACVSFISIYYKLI